jgi:ribosomal-protein-serine acetyltransferase
LNGKTEIGYWLSEPLQGKGIVTKSTKKLIEIAFEKEQMNRIQIKCAVDNLPSKRIPQRLSFTLEGIEREGELLANKEYTDLEVYSLLRSDYERNKHIYINNIYER